MADGQKQDVDVANQAFYSNSFVINLGGRDVFIDFQRVAPRFDVNNPQKGYTVNEHATIIINAVMFKELMKVGSEFVRKLEEKFGDITTPEFIEKLGEEQQKTLMELEKKSKGKKDEELEYFG